MKRFILILIFILYPAVSGSQDALQQNLEIKHENADRREKEVRALTQKAGKISTRLTSIEQQIASLKHKIQAQELILDEIKKNEQKARQEHFVLEKEKQQIILEISGLMRTLWPVHLQNVRSRFEGVDSWDTFDRRFTWLTAIYKATNEKLEEARVNSERILRNLDRQRVLEDEAERQLAIVNRSKDKLLGSKHSLRRNLRLVRKKRVNAERELSDILSSIEELKYQLQSQKTKRFALYKRALPWPVRGTLVTGFNLKTTPPSRGLVIKTGKDASVRSVFWGKVVHNDTLRGFGHVVIVYHGYDYYSLYAYLSKTHVRNGQEVEKDEPIGVVGYYPKTNGDGLYFELRFHQKPINPKLWLTSQK